MSKFVLCAVFLLAAFSLGSYAYCGVYRHLPVHFSLSTFDLLFLLILVLCVLLVLLAWAFQKIYFLGLNGRTRLALQLSRGFFWLPKIRHMLEAMILFHAGRYGEAREKIRREAFDEAGNPRLKSRQIYVHALCCCNEGNEAEAERYLEMAITANPENMALKSVCTTALVVVLLMENKDLPRACALMEQEVGNRLIPLRPEDKARRYAVLARALASSSRRKETEQAIAQALALSAKCSATERAGVLYTVGEAWHALGEDQLARKAFAESLQLRTDGVTALSTRNALARMDACLSV